jgi:hypothetical protein
VLLAWLIGADRNDPGDDPKAVGWRHRVAAGYAALDRRQHLVLIMAATLGVETAWALALVLGVGNPSGRWSPSPR